MNHGAAEVTPMLPRVIFVHRGLFSLLLLALIGMIQPDRSFWAGTVGMWIFFLNVFFCIWLQASACGLVGWFACFLA